MKANDYQYSEEAIIVAMAKKWYNTVANRLF